MTIKDFDKFFQKSILVWGSQNFRSFSWRESTNPYHFLVVEILLQKTKAEQVEEIFSKFIKKYPNIKSLAKSNINDLIEIVKPLGLYYRAERLKGTAQQIENDFNGTIPENEKELILLNGVGKYIARAILCFGFNKKVSIMDVNIGRILIRFFGLQEPKRIRDSKDLWGKADILLPNKDIRKFNLYLLDFGSLICEKRKPKCNICPLNYHCAFFKKSKKIIDKTNKY